MGKLLSIVIDNNFIRIAELSVTKRGVSVSRLLSKEMPGRFVEDGAVLNVREFADFLISTLRYANIRTKHVVFSLPNEKVMTREIVLPELGEEKLRITLKANAAEYFPIDLSDYVLSYFPISRILPDDQGGQPEEGKDRKKKTEKGSKKGKKEKKNRNKMVQLRLMAVAAPNDLVQAYYDVARLARLKMESVDYIGNSVFQLTAGQIGEETCLVIQLDRNNTVLTIYNNNVMSLQRHIDFGSMSVIQAVAEQAQTDYEQAEQLLEHDGLIHDNFDDGDTVTDSLYYLVSNIKRVIEYYAGRNADCPLEQVYVMGEGSVMPGLDLLIENQLNLPAETITALKQVSVRESTGLSIREVLKYMDNIGAAIAPVNFIPKKLEQDMRRHLEAKAYRVMILLALFAALVIVTAPTTKFFSTAMDTMDLKNKLLTVEDAKPILEKYNQAEQRYLDVRKVEAYTRTNNQSLRQFLDIFEQLRPSNISITSFQCAEGQVSFSALASGKSTVAKLIQQLSMIANVSDVEVSSLSSSFEGSVETVAFSVTCRLINSDAMLGEGSQDSETGYPLEEQEIYEDLEEKLPYLDEYEGIMNNMDDAVNDAIDGLEQSADETGADSESGVAAE